MQQPDVKCPACGGKAIVAPRSGISAIAAYTVVLAVPLFALGYLGVPRVALFAVCGAAALAMPLVIARVCRFEVHEARR